MSYETVAWNGDKSQIPRGRRQIYAPTYDAAVTPTIADVERLDLDTATTAAADDAAREITRFDAELSGEIAPFASVLLRTESAASSQIENLTASAKSIGLAELDETTKQNARLIVANVRAMRSALDLADRLDEDAIIEMHRELLVAESPGIVGSWRKEQVWVGGSSFGPHEASFIAPHHERVPAAMADLVAFMARDDLPVLSHAAIAHAQFETIHPFPDGNGRTGRALVHSMLRAKGMTRSITVPVSAGLLADTTAYFDALGAFRDGDPNPIVEQMATAAHRSIVNGRRLVDDMHAARDEWRSRITARRDAAVHRVADHLLTQPVVTAPLLARVLGVSDPTVKAAVDQLSDLGIIADISGRSRNRVWVAHDIVEALDAFAARAGRRG